MDIHPATFLFTLIALTVWHELGHWTAARWAGIPVVSLNIGWGPVIWRQGRPDAAALVLRALPVGMSVSLPARRTTDGQETRPPAYDRWVAAAGPLANLALTLLLFVAARYLPLSDAWAYNLVGVGLLSAGMALLNLLPLPGLDGGHLVLLTAAAHGWELPPRREFALHRYGVYSLIGLSLVVLVML